MANDIAKYFQRLEVHRQGSGIRKQNTKAKYYQL